MIHNNANSFAVHLIPEDMREFRAKSKIPMAKILLEIHFIHLKL